MQGPKLVIALVVCLLGAACSPRNFLTRRLAGDLITYADAFKTQQQFSLRLGVVSNKDYLSPEYLVLERRGCITGSTVSCSTEGSPPPSWDVARTPMSVETLRTLIPTDGGSTQRVTI